MWISRIQIANIRSIRRADLELSRNINILIGPNNSGKSTIISAAYLLQKSNSLGLGDARLNAGQGEIHISLTDEQGEFFRSHQGMYAFKVSRNEGANLFVGGPDVRQIDQKEPGNLIYPFLSKRKVVSYDEAMNEANTSSIVGNFRFLYSRIDKVSNADLAGNSFYKKACEDILGFRVTCIASENGKKAAYIVDNWQSITIDKMGEGVINILGLIVDLSVAENRIFLLEEPENDIHPKALKGLLGLIVEKSNSNQFIITTHSNIVTKYLGAASSTAIFESVTGFEKSLPISTVKKVDNSPESRRKVLENLGYELGDEDLWDAWLFLEESSAETVIRTHLIRWFMPNLAGKLKTFSCKGVNNVSPKFEDFNTLFCFLNMQPVYKNKVWVIIDAGQKEDQIIQELKDKYTPNGWHEDRFLQFTKHDFEEYYPMRFDAKHKEILAMPVSMDKRERKLDLLKEVEAWIAGNEQEARKEFEISAKEVIDALKEIQNQLHPEPSHQ